MYYTFNNLSESHNNHFNLLVSYWSQSESCTIEFPTISLASTLASVSSEKFPKVWSETRKVTNVKVHIQTNNRNASKEQLGTSTNGFLPAFPTQTIPNSYLCLMDRSLSEPARLPFDRQHIQEVVAGERKSRPFFTTSLARALALSPFHNCVNYYMAEKLCEPLRETGAPLRCARVEMRVRSAI